MDHFSCAHFRCMCKRDLFFKPGSLHHPLCIFFQMPRCPFYHIAYTVDQPEFQVQVFLQMNDCRFLRNEFRFGCHNCFSGTGLWQFISCPCLFMLILHIRQHQHIHKSLDKCRFSGPHRSDHTYIDFSVRSCFYILVHLKRVHMNTPLLC